MKTIKLFLIIISALVVTSCHKRPPKTYTIKGKLIENCGGAVMANTDMSVTTRPSLPMKQNLLNMKFTSDSDGNFSVSYQKAAGEKISLRVNGNKRITEIPKYKDIDLGVIYYYSTCNFVFKVVMDSAYSAMDTLYITNFNNNSPPPHSYAHIIPGPFIDTILPAVYNYSQIKRGYLHLGKIYVPATWEVWNGPLFSNHKIKAGVAEQDLYLNECNDMDTFLLRIN